MKYILLTFSVFASLSAAASAQLACKDAEKLVKRYIELDQIGETLIESKKVDDLVDMTSGDRPAWDALAVSKESRVLNCTKTGDSFSVEVVSDVYGSGNLQMTEPELDLFTARPTQKEGQKIKLNLIKGILKIDPATLAAPHPIVESLRKLLYIKNKLSECYKNYIGAFADVDNRKKNQEKVRAQCLDSDFIAKWSSLASVNGMDADPLLIAQDYLESWKSEIQISNIRISDMTAKVLLGKGKETHCLNVKLSSENLLYKIKSVQKCEEKNPQSS